MATNTGNAALATCGRSFIDRLVWPARFAVPHPGALASSSTPPPPGAPAVLPALPALLLAWLAAPLTSPALDPDWLVSLPLAPADLRSVPAYRRAWPANRSNRPDGPVCRRISGTPAAAFRL